MTRNKFHHWRDPRLTIKGRRSGLRFSTDAAVVGRDLHVPWGCAPGISHLTCLQLRLTRFAVRSYAAWPWVHRRRTNDRPRSTRWHTDRYISKLTERHCLQVGVWCRTGHYAITTGARFTSLREPQDDHTVCSECSGCLLN